MLVMEGSRKGARALLKAASCPPLSTRGVSLGLEGTSRSTAKEAAQSTRSGILNLNLNPGLTGYHLEKVK